MGFNNRPALAFYVSDWFRHPGLRTCSLAARGLAIDMIALMHDGAPYGHLVVSGVSMTVEALARRVGESVGDVSTLLSELLAVGVFERRSDGTIFSPRMVRDEALRLARANGGRKSIEHPTVAARMKASTKDEPKDTLAEDREGSETVSSPPPLSSSSSSSSSSSISDTHVCADQDANGFDAFWASYPRRVGKDAARRAWARLAPDMATQRAITAAIAQQRQTDQWKRHVVPNPATWLNEGRWQDEPTQATSSTRSNASVMSADETSNYLDEFRKVPA